MAAQEIQIFLLQIGRSRVKVYGLRFKVYSLRLGHSLFITHNFCSNEIRSGDFNADFLILIEHYPLPIPENCLLLLACCSLLIQLVFFFYCL